MSTAWPTEIRTAWCTRTYAHEPHEVRDGACPGLSHLGSLTLPQIEATANALGLDPGRLAISLVTAMTEARR